MIRTALKLQLANLSLTVADRVVHVNVNESGKVIRRRKQKCGATFEKLFEFLINIFITALTSSHVRRNINFINVACNVNKVTRNKNLWSE
jgi:KaiC/GvpD/RAD55 family RecA-like ATPase